MNVIEQLGLRHDPFGPASSASGFGVAASLLVAQEKLLAAVGRGDPLTVLTGRPGMGKTLLLSMVEQAYRGDGIEVRSVARGDMAHVALGSGAQLLLIDEADTINTATLRALAPGTADAAAPTMVFAVARPALHRLSSDVRATIIDLRPLDPEEARDFLLARTAAAGRLDLFSPEALDVIVEAGQGSPRLLRVLAGAAMFQAASDGAAQISAAHAGLAAAMHGKLLGVPSAEPALPVAANDLEPALDAAEDRPRTVVPLARRRSRYQRAGALSFAASVALAALVLPLVVFPESADAPSVGVTTASAAQATSAPVQLAAAAFTVAPARAAATVPLRPTTAEPPLRLAAATAPPLITVPPRIATAALDTRAAPIRPLETRIVTEGAGVARAVRPEPVAGADRALLIDLLAATRLRPAVAERDSGSQGPAEELAGEVGRSAAALIAAIAPAADPPATTSPPVVTASFAPLPAIAEPRAADATETAKLAAEQAKEAARQVEAAKAVAGQGKAAKAAADQAAAAKEAAAQAKAGKAAAEQAKAAKEAAEQTKAAKEAADQAKGAKEAAEQAKAAKESAEQAKAAKEAAEQAKAAKEAADHAKDAKEAAEQAKAAKEAADQAKAAKEAADQAKAAKEAVDQAKAAKEAADQAKAAKEAVEQAKAAKDAADQAKAAKEAVEQAKAAKDAADQAKAARDAAEQAKEAARTAKDAAKAAKDAIKAAKEAARGN